MTTEKQPPGCPAACTTEGFPLAWPSAKIAYALNERGFPNMSEETLRRIARESFATWEAVTCEVGDEEETWVPVGFEFEQQEGFTTREVGPQSEEPNENTIVHFSREAWEKKGYDPRAFALTSNWFDKHTGRILGADIHFNGGMNFGECPARGCPEEAGIADLRNVLTHEIGHLLGLSHSADPRASMWCDARAGDVNKRVLGDDDIEGICAAYPPGEAFPDDREPPAQASTGRCAVGLPGPSGSLDVALGALMAAFAVRRRRRATRYSA